MKIHDFDLKYEKSSLKQDLYTYCTYQKDFSEELCSVIQEEITDWLNDILYRFTKRKKDHALRLKPFRIKL